MASRFPKDQEKKTRSVDRLVTQALKIREPVLPKVGLENYLRALLEKRTILKESAFRFGTPQYFFDEPALAGQVARLRDTFSKAIPGCRTFYAMKSNSFQGICRYVVKAGMGLDVSSGWELSKALAMGCNEILFSGPGKTDEELLLACQHPGRVTLLMDSEGELERLSTITKRQEQGGRPLRVGIRVRTHSGGMWDKFGIPLKDLEGLMRAAIRVEGIELRGIQFHTSWNLDPAPQVKMIDAIGAHVRDHISETLWPCLHFLDIGGGFWPEQGEWLNPENTLRGKILQLLDSNYPFRRKHYLLGAKPLHDFAAQIASALLKQGPPLSLVEVWMEPGRWIANPAMHILLTVVDKKDARTVITDGGTNLLGWERP
jgi:diaminopimelate decarboxylase